MKIQIRTDVHAQLRQQAKANNIKLEDLTNCLLSKMLNHHHDELRKIIQEVKQK